MKRVLPLILSLVLLWGCRPPSVAPARATAQVEAAGISTVVGPAGWSGTGWYIATSATASVVATAGHVCMGPADTVAMGFYEVDGREAYAFYDRDEHLVEDVCLLLVDGPAPAVIPLAKTAARPGDAVSYRGYPGGVLTVQHGEVMDVAEDTLLVAIDGYYGASGSAIVRDGRAVGMLVAGHMDHGPVGSVVATGLPALRRALGAARAMLRRLEVEPIATVRDVVAASVRGEGRL